MKRSRLSVFIVYWLLCISSAVGAANFRLFQIPRNISGTAGPAKRYSEPVGPTDSASEDSPRLLAVSYSRDQRFYSLSCSLQFITAAKAFPPEVSVHSFTRSRLYTWGAVFWSVSFWIFLSFN